MVCERAREREGDNRTCIMWEWEMGDGQTWPRFAECQNEKGA